MHLLEPLGHLLEALAQALLQRGVQLLVDGGAHLLELGLVALLQQRQATFDGLPHLGQAALVGLAQRLQLLGHRRTEALQALGQLSAWRRKAASCASRAA